MKILTSIAVISGLMFCLPLQAMPITYDFFQDGYAAGAQLTGQFVGEDLDNNGQLSSFAGEISGFQLRFEGAGWLASFELGMEHLAGLVYALDGGVLGDGPGHSMEGLLAFGDHALLAAGPGPFWHACDQAMVCSVALSGYHALFSEHSIQVSQHPVPVPEPGTVGLILIGVVGLVIARRQTVAGSRNSRLNVAK